MTTRTTARTPGELTWIDLATPDLEGAKRFYQQLFGWEYVDTGAEFGHYHMALAQGRNAAGIAAIQPGQETPPAWTVYFASADIDIDVARVRALGGLVLFEPMTIGDSGRMAVCTDPTGAVFGLWQADQHIGAGVENEHGGMAWCEVATRDVATACNFYAQLLGFTPQKVEGMDYFMLQRNGESYCGVMQMDEQWEGIPPHWMAYFAVDDADAALERVVAGGGKVLVPAFDMAYGRMAVIADPAGAAVSIVKLAIM